LTNEIGSDIIRVTNQGAGTVGMDKEEVLRENGSFNPQYSRVSDMMFQNSRFFDARDIVQVKYEMLRSVQSGERNVSQASKEFGFSRESYYKNKRLFEADGLGALVPRKPGARSAYKFNDEGKAFVTGYAKEHPHAKSNEISRQMEQQTGLKVHPRTIDRFFQKKGSSRG